MSAEHSHQQQVRKTIGKAMRGFAFAAAFFPSTDAVAQTLPPHRAAIEAMSQPTSTLVQSLPEIDTTLYASGNKKKEKPPDAQHPDRPTFCPDGSEPDNFVTQAKPGTLNGLPDVHTFHDAGDVDWISVNLREGYTCWFEALGWWNITDTEMTLVGPDMQTVLAYNDDHPAMPFLSSRIDWVSTVTAPHYLKVNELYGRGDCLGYHLTLTCFSPYRSYLPIASRVIEPSADRSTDTAGTLFDSSAVGTNATDWNEWDSLYSNADSVRLQER
jgi:hypothetical protein